MRIRVATSFISVFRKTDGSFLRSGPLRAASLSIDSRKASSEPHIVRSAWQEIKIPEVHFNEFTWQHKKKFVNKTALVDEMTGRSFDYPTLELLSRRFGSALRKRGYSKGQVIAAILPNCAAFPIHFAGAVGIGMTVTTINPTYTPSEIAKQMAMSRSSVAITISTLLPKVQEAVLKLGQPMDIIVVDKPVDENIFLEDLLADDGSEYPVSYDDFDHHNDVVVLPYSSGTTGVPKGVQLTHRNLIANVAQLVFLPEIEFAQIGSDPQDVTVCILPMFHIFGMIVTLFAHLHCGTKIVTLPSFEPKSFLQAIEKHKPTFLHLAPPLVGFLVNHPDVKPHHLESLRYVMVGAAPLGETLYNQFKAKAPHVALREGWGMTELSPVGTITTPDMIVGGSCGPALPNTDMKVVDLSTGENLGPNIDGELCIRGPQVMKGYLDNEQATKDTLKNGWLHTGDIAHYDEKGLFYIVDRLKELIKVKGFQVPPAELEDLLRTHPDVMDVAVIGIPDERMGEVPRAYIVKKNPGLNEDTIHKFIDEEVSDYKKLRGGIEFLEAIPKTASGKILRKDLKAQYEKQNL